MERADKISTAKKSTIVHQSVLKNGHAAPLFFQPKLTIGPVDDAYEREADAVADHVMRLKGTEHLQTKISPIGIQRKCAACEKEEHLQRQHSDETSIHPDASSLVSDVINTGGRPMESNTKSFMENRFGYDFNSVKVHTDPVAAKSAQSINALAYTSGSNIVFNHGQYAPDTDSGKRLLAHELTHTIQQGAAGKHTGASVVQKQEAPPVRKKTIWLNIGFDSSAVADTATMQKLRASIAAEKAAIASCCSARSTGCDVQVKTLYDWNRVNKPAPTDGDYDNDIAADANLRNSNIANINTGRSGGIRMLVTGSTLSQTWQGARIFANANSGTDNLIWNVNAAPVETLAHETGHIGGYSGGDIEGNDHSSDPDNIMSRGNIRNAGALPDADWCTKVSALAV